MIHPPNEYNLSQTLISTFNSVTVHFSFHSARKPLNEQRGGADALEVRKPLQLPLRAAAHPGVPEATLLPGL